MIFQLRTDNHIRSSADFTESLRADVESTLASRFGNRLQRVGVYLEDLNGGKGGIDIRCSVEVHLAGYPVVAAEGRAEDVDTAAQGALEKVLHLLEHKLGRKEDRARHVATADAEEL